MALFNKISELKNRIIINFIILLTIALSCGYVIKTLQENIIIQKNDFNKANDNLKISQKKLDLLKTARLDDLKQPNNSLNYIYVPCSFDNFLTAIEKEILNNNSENFSLNKSYKDVKLSNNLIMKIFNTRFTYSGSDLTSLINITDKIYNALPDYTSIKSLELSDYNENNKDNISILDNKIYAKVLFSTISLKLLD